MQHTAHQALTARLNMWREFFTTGVDTTPTGATGVEYDIDHLMDLAHMTNVPHIIELAELVGLMADNYTRKMDLDIFDALMQDDTALRLHARNRATPSMMAELDAVLAGA